MLSPWEYTEDGKQAQVGNQYRPVSPNVRGLILHKITDLEVVRATFSGQKVTFDPYVKLLLTNAKQASGFTVLFESFPQQDISVPSSPNACVRYCNWDGSGVKQGIPTAIDKREFVYATPSLRCSMRFFFAANTPLLELMDRTTKVLSEGIAFEPCSRGESEPEELDFWFCNGFQTFQFSFSPRLRQASRLEEVCCLWRKMLEPLARQIGVTPDDNCNVDYAESIWERIAKYG